MAERVLSQEEVDALMRGVTSGEIETETDKTMVGGVRKFDLTSQERVVRGRLPSMEMVNERFCRSFRLSLFNLTRKVVDVTVDGPKMMKYGEYINNVPLPASFNLVQMPPLRGQSLLVFDAGLIFLLLDNLFGGGGKYYARIEGRDFSILEQRVIKKLVDISFNDMKSSWKTIIPLEFVYCRSEVNPQFVNVIVPSEVVMVSTFNIEIDSIKTKMSFCVPYSTVEPIKEKLHASHQSDRMEVDKRWMTQFENEIRRLSVEANCEIGRAEISLDEFINLSAGDIIQLDRRTSDNVLLKVEGVPKFLGKIGLSNGQYAVQITANVKREEG